MKLAAASIMVGTKPTVAEGVAILEEALKDATSDREKTNILLALDSAYWLQDNFARLLEVSSALLKQDPESRLAFIHNVQALMGLGRHDEAIAPGRRAAEAAGGRCRRVAHENDGRSLPRRLCGGTRGARKLVDQGKQNAEIFNEIAWYALFIDKVEQADIATAIKATELAKDNPHILHTLACLYAVTGKSNEAHDLLLRGMDELDLDEPNDDYWYALGLHCRAVRRVRHRHYRLSQAGKAQVSPLHSHLQLPSCANAAQGAGRGWERGRQVAHSRELNAARGSAWPGLRAGTKHTPNFFSVTGTPVRRYSPGSSGLCVY